MGMKYLWDPNIAIYYLQQQFPKMTELFVDDLVKESRIAISAITEIELLCWKAAKESDLKVLNEFISDCFVIDLEQEIKLKTADIRKKYNIKLPDAIIAATAMVYSLGLVTRNEKDFMQIEGLNIINPFNIKQSGPFY